MCNRELILWIKQLRTGNHCVFDLLYEAFGKLIRYYAKRLGTDDGQQELTLFFLELLHRLDTSRFPPDESSGLQKYIAVSLRNQYIALSKAAQLQREITAGYCEEISVCETDPDTRLVLAGALARLTGRQRQIVVYKYCCGYSIREIGERLHISRQAANQTLQRGLLIMRQYLEDTGSGGR